MNIEQNFLQFADLRPETLLLVAADGTVVAANRAVERLGHAVPEIRGRPLTDMVADDADNLGAYLQCLHTHS